MKRLRSAPAPAELSSLRCCSVAVHMRRVCSSSTVSAAKLFKHVHHYSTACYHHFCSSSRRLSCLQGWRVGGHLHLSRCFVCHCILSNWDSVLSCTETAKMP